MLFYVKRRGHAEIETLQNPHRGNAPPPTKHRLLRAWDYYFEGTNCFFEFTDSEGLPLPYSTRLLTQDYEKKAYVARSRTKAIGAAGLKYAPYALAHGSITNNISLQDASLGFVGGAAFGNSRADHGGQVYKTIQNSGTYYKQLLQVGFQIERAP
jgi:hypothetical protein